MHCEIGTFGHEVVDILLGHGARPDRIILAHLDRNPDAELHAEIAARGVSLEYDTMGRTKYRPDSELLDLVQRVVEAGHLARLMLGQDLGRAGSLRAYGGGPGMRYLMERFVPRVRRRIGDEATHAILVDNPARAFAIEPGAA